MALALAPRTDEVPVALERLVPSGPRHELAVVVLTQANRPAELVRAIASVRAQRGVDVQLVLVLNGAAPRAQGGAVDVPWLAPDDRLVVLPENVGIPGGRNVGAGVADAGLLLFLDDDAELLGPTVLATAVRALRGRRPAGRHGDPAARRGRPDAAPPRPAGRRRLGRAVRAGHPLHRCGLRGARRRLRDPRRLRPPVLLRDGGVGPVLAAPRRRLVHLVLRRPHRLPPAHHAVAAPRARAAHRPEPHVGVAALAPGARCASPTWSSGRWPPCSAEGRCARSSPATGRPGPPAPYAGRCGGARWSG